MPHRWTQSLNMFYVRAVEVFEERQNGQRKGKSHTRTHVIFGAVALFLFFSFLSDYNWERNNSNRRADIGNRSKIHHQYHMNFVLWHAESKTKRNFRCVRERMFWCGQILICNFKNRNNLCACGCVRVWERAFVSIVRMWYEWRVVRDEIFFDLLLLYFVYH